MKFIKKVNEGGDNKKYIIHASLNGESGWIDKEGMLVSMMKDAEVFNNKDEAEDAIVAYKDDDASSGDHWEYDIVEYHPSQVNESITDNTMSIASSIIDNIKDEEEAIQGYYRMLLILEGMFENNLLDEVKFTELRNQINEVISDEKNHAKVLKDMQFYFDQIQTAKD